jgi:hypothetical protein
MGNQPTLIFANTSAPNNDDTTQWRLTSLDWNGDVNLTAGNVGDPQRFFLYNCDTTAAGSLGATTNVNTLDDLIVYIDTGSEGPEVIGYGTSFSGVSSIETPGAHINFSVDAIQTPTSANTEWHSFNSGQGVSTSVPINFPEPTTMGVSSSWNDQGGYGIAVMFYAPAATTGVKEWDTVVGYTYV